MKPINPTRKIPGKIQKRAVIGRCKIRRKLIIDITEVTTPSQIRTMTYYDKEYRKNSQ